MGRSRRRKKKSKAFIRYFCLFICAVILFTSLLIGDDTKAYGEGRSAIYKNPINPDYESNDKDKREKYVKFTKKGNKLAKPIIMKLEELENGVLDEMDEESRYWIFKSSEKFYELFNIYVIYAYATVF